MNANRHNDNLIRELYRLSRKILIPQFSTSCVYGSEFICENCTICLLRLYMKCFSTKCNSNKIASETFRIKIFMNGNEEELVQISFWRDAFSLKQQRLVHDVESRTLQVKLFTNLYAPIHSTVLFWCGLSKRKLQMHVLSVLQTLTQNIWKERAEDCNCKPFRINL